MLQLTVMFSPGRISSVPFSTGTPQRHSSTRTHPPSCNSRPSGHRHPAAQETCSYLSFHWSMCGRGQSNAGTWMTGPLQTLDVLPQVSTAAGTLIGAGVVKDPPSVLTMLTCDWMHISNLAHIWKLNGGPHWIWALLLHFLCLFWKFSRTALNTITRRILKSTKVFIIKMIAVVLDD